MSQFIIPPFILFFLAKIICRLEIPIPKHLKYHQHIFVVKSKVNRYITELSGLILSTRECMDDLKLTSKIKKSLDLYLA
jgi:hypothetical protein